MIVTKRHLDEAKTVRGGYTLGQVALGKKITGEHRWAGALIGKNIEDSEWSKFMGMKDSGKRKKTKYKPIIINPVSSKSDDWSWSPEVKDIPAPKFKGKLSKNKGKKKKRRRKVSKQDNIGFYSSREWLELRVRVLEKYECKCMMCGRSPKLHNIVIHVDHIKPRSKFPYLSLDFNNLQLLCAACNRGKSNKYETDWRPHEQDISNELDDHHLTSIQHLI